LCKPFNSKEKETQFDNQENVCLQNRSGIFHIHDMNMSLSLTLTVPAHHTSPAYLTPPTVPRMFVKVVPTVCVKDALHLKQ